MRQALVALLAVSSLTPHASTAATPAVDWIKVYSRRPRGTKGDGKVAGDSGAPDMPEN